MDFLETKKTAVIEQVKARQIFDSRGTPTVEATVTLTDGSCGTASVPSGASTGMFEACELRDGYEELNGKGVTQAVGNVNTIINKGLMGLNPCDQKLIDDQMIELDGTKNKSKVGANGILAVSLATAKAAANFHRIPLYRYLGGMNGITLPVPMMNILNGGAHASNNVDIQEFMIMPVGAESFSKGMQMCVEIYHALGKLLKERNLSTGVGDEGGFAPNLEHDEQALELILEAVQKAGYQPQEDIRIALDAASSEWYRDGHYLFPKKQKRITQSELMDYFEDLIRKYPIVSLEDPLAEEDFTGFQQFTKRVGEKVQIVGDDLFVTNKERLQRGIDLNSANAILIKPNQIGTLTETLETIRLAKQHGYRTIISHRSGETEDTTIADIAVAVNAGEIKTGAPARTDRICKYNRLLAIEQELGKSANYPGNSIFS